MLDDSWHLLLAVGTYRIRQALPSGTRQTGPATNASLVVSVPDTGAAVAVGDLLYYVRDTTNGVITFNPLNDVIGNGVAGPSEADAAFSPSTPIAYKYMNDDNNPDNGEPVARADNGVYVFSGIAPGMYHIAFVLTTRRTVTAW